MIIRAIKLINPDAEVCVRGENSELTDYNIDNCTFEWLNGTSEISVEDIKAQFPIVEFDMAMADLRTKRNKLLADTDYTVLQDSTYTDEQVAEWVIYRQALRDITENLTTLEQVQAVEFPTKP